MDPAWPGVAEAAGLPVDVFVLDEMLLHPEAMLAAAFARRILAPTVAVAQRFADAGLAGDVVTVATLPLPPGGQGPQPDKADARDAIGIVPPDASPATYAFIRAFAQAMLERRSSRNLVVFGSTFRDIGLMRLGNVFVTGPLGDDPPDEVLAVHRCSGLLLAQRTGPSSMRPSTSSPQRACPSPPSTREERET